MENARTPVRKIIRYTLAVLAGIALLAAGLLLYDFYRLSPQRVYQKYYRKYEVNGPLGLFHDSSLLALYRSGNYEGVIARYRSLPDSGRAETLLTGIACLETGDPARAIQLLGTAAIPSHDTIARPLWEAADFYQALAYIRNKDFDFALERLRVIRDEEEHYYHRYVTSRLIRRVKLLKWR